jgi:hypothetical protein
MPELVDSKRSHLIAEYPEAKPIARDDCYRGV